MENLHRAVACVATALDIPFGGLTVTPNPNFKREK